jgi:RNA polymerase sigma factor (TIGR02999 family)
VFPAGDREVARGPASWPGRRQRRWPPHQANTSPASASGPLGHTGHLAYGSRKLGKRFGIFGGRISGKSTKQDCHHAGMHAIAAKYGKRGFSAWHRASPPLQRHPCDPGAFHGKLRRLSWGYTHHRRRPSMSEATRILSAIEQGDPNAAAQLLPLVYDELRQLAAAKLAQEKPGQTLEATALVHEAYLRLVGGEPDAQWNSRGHFIAAAAEAMRRILVENARRKKADKHGGTRQRIDLSQAEPLAQADPDAILDLDEALTLLAGEDPQAAAVARLRIFVGLSVEEAAQVLSTSRANAYRQWAYARAWLHARLRDRPGAS